MERGGRWHAASRSGTARWHPVARRGVHLVALSGIRWCSAAGFGLRGRFGASQKIGWLDSCSAPAQISVRSALVGMDRSAAHSGTRWCSVALENCAPLNAKVESFMSLEGLGATRCHSVAGGARRYAVERVGSRRHAVTPLGGTRWRAVCALAVSYTHLTLPTIYSV